MTHTHTLSDDVVRQPAGKPAPIARALLKFLIWCLLLICLDRLAFSILLEGYTRYFGLHQANEIVFVGNSRTALGVDHKLVEQQLGIPCGKFALNGANAKNRYAMVEHLIEDHSRCKMIVFDVSAYTFNDRNLSAAAYTLLFPYMDSAPIADHIQSSAQSWHEPLTRRLFRLTRFNSTTLNLAIRGWLGRDDNMKFSEIDLSRAQHRIDSGRTQSLVRTKEGERLVRETAQAATDSGIQFVLLHLPVVDLFNDVDRHQHDENIQILKRLTETSDSITYLDFNTGYEQRYDLLFDGLHLNAEGKRVISTQIADQLRALSSSPKLSQSPMD